jgi:hypothetical protein
MCRPSDSELALRGGPALAVRERLRPLGMGSIVQMPVSNSQLTSVNAGQSNSGGRDRV